MQPEAARSARELQMLEAMVDCAHALGLAFAEAAKAEGEHRRWLELFDAFQKGFLAVRMGIRLSMTLRGAPRAAPAASAVRPEPPERPETLERERPEHDRPERGEPLERERDRDYEPVSLPRFLNTLGLVARDAARLGDRLPAGAATDALPRLQGLLAGARAADAAAGRPAPPKATGAAVLAYPPQVGTRRSLLGSAATPGSGPRAPPRWTGSG